MESLFSLDYTKMWTCINNPSRDKLYKQF